MPNCCAPSVTRDVATTHALPNPDTARVHEPSRMAFVPDGTFLMGNDDDRAIPGDGEGPVREVHVSGFLLDHCCVTNRQFATFVDATGHVSDAEQHGWSYVFAPLVGASAIRHVIRAQVAGAPWWRAVVGAKWSAPEGPGSTVHGRWNHPVVHVSWQDARAYAAWVGKRLPTEAEWEKAARGGTIGHRYSWGDELVEGGRHHANIWQGTFPTSSSRPGGVVGTVAVDTFPANAFGLHNMAGNVWEWCRDAWSATWHIAAAAPTRRDPEGPATGHERVMRGGSYLCHASYCERYRVAARTKNTPDATAGHIGFRCAADVPPAPDIRAKDCGQGA